MNLSYEQIQGAIVQLPLYEQQRLLNELGERLAGAHPVGIPMTNGQQSDFDWPAPEPNDDWLIQNADKYRGQWVALYNGELIAHGNDSQVFAQAVKASGVQVPLIVFIEPPSAAPEFIGWL
jgi:hypothetical protein